MKYNIYAGLSGGFGGANYIGTLDASLADAEDAAYEYAIEEYESYEGMHGLLTWDDIAEENGLDPENDLYKIDDLYLEQVNDWIEYYAIPFNEDPIDPQDYYEL